MFVYEELNIRYDHDHDDVEALTLNNSRHFDVESMLKYGRYLNIDKIDTIL